jgi:hypothetical protein
MRTIRRDEMALSAPLRLGQPVADKLGVMIAGVVQVHVDHPNGNPPINLNV